jgi:hypothetical protein
MRNLKKTLFLASMFRLREPKFNLAPWCVCLLYQKKLYFKVLKKFNKKFYMYISIIYVCSSSFTKTIISL